MNYYAYGSNLSTRYLRDYCPSARYVMKASLPNYRVEFRRYSEILRGGISSIVERPGGIVHGCLFDIAPAEIHTLDVLENVPEGIYRRDTFVVLGENGCWHKADLYRVATPTGPYPPALEYLDHIIAGAREHALDADYTEALVRLRDSVKDGHTPDEAADDERAAAD